MLHCTTQTQSIMTAVYSKLVTTYPSSMALIKGLGYFLEAQNIPHPPSPSPSSSTLSLSQVIPPEPNLPVVMSMTDWDFLRPAGAPVQEEEEDPHTNRPLLDDFDAEIAVFQVRVVSL